MFSFTFISSKRREIANEHIKCEQKTNRKEMEEEKNNERTEPNKAVYLTTVVDTIDTAKFPSERYQMWWKRVKCVQSWFYDLALLAPLDTPNGFNKLHSMEASSHIQFMHCIFSVTIQFQYCINASMYRKSMNKKRQSHHLSHTIIYWIIQ